MTQVTFVEHYEGGWEALYIDGKRVYENHRITPFRFLLELVGYRITEVNHIEADASKHGAHFPENLSDL